MPTGIRFDPIADFLRTSRRGAARAGARFPAYPDAMSQEEIGSLLSNVLSPLAYLGESLDKPGAAIRGLLAGKPAELLNLIPFSDALGITSSEGLLGGTPLQLTDDENTVYGRDLLEQYGILEDNQPGLDFGDVAGFGLDVLLDPLTYLGGVGLLKGLGKGGHILTKAGAKAGSRLGRMTTNVSKLADTVPAEALESAARGSGFRDTAEFLAAHGEEAVGGLLSYNLPFGRPLGALGTGKGSQWVGSKLDALGGAVRGSLPGREAFRLFSQEARGGRSVAEQQFGKKVSQMEGKAAAEIDSFSIALARTIREVDPNLLSEDGMSALRNAFELPFDEIPNALRAVSGTVDEKLKTVLVSAVDAGVDVKGLKDDFTRFFPRKTEGFGLEPELGSRRSLETLTGHALSRRDYLRDIPGSRTEAATETLRSMFKDEELAGLLASGAKKEELADYLRGAWSDVVPETYHVFARESKGLTIGKKGQLINAKVGDPLYDNLGNPVMGDRFEKLAILARQKYNKDPELLAKGIFHADPLDDMYRYLHSIRRAEITGRTMSEFLLDDKFLKIAGPGEPQPITLSKMLRQMRLNPKKVVHNNPGVADEIAAMTKGLKPRKAAAVENEIVGRFLSQRISSDSYFQIHKMTSFAKSEDAAGSVEKIYRWGHNLWKGSVTGPWPAFQTRNFIGSQIQNVLVGLLRPTRVFIENKNAHLLVTGRQIADAHLIPEVKSILKNRGLPDESGTDVLRELITANKVWQPGVNVAADVAGEVKERGGFRGLLERIPGGLGGDSPLYTPGAEQPLKEYGRQMLGIGDDVTYNLRKAEMRGGWTGAERSTFAPFAAGEKLGNWIEGQARISPFMDMLRRGISPKVAAERVAAAQVDYSSRAFTQFEKKLQLLFPFYSFGSRQAKFLAGELIDRPGGPIAQTIRAGSRATSDDPFLPSHIRQGLAIPLGEADDGTKRFINSLGLMHEDPLSLAQSTPSGFGMELLSRATIPIKGALEKITGQSFFQRGRTGGRQLSDLDPSLGRLISNVMGDDDPYPTPPGLEFLLSNSPLSRAIGTARTAFDDRKSIPVRALRLGTGIGVTDVSPQAQSFEMREALVEVLRAMKPLGVRNTEIFYVNPASLARRSPEEQAEVTKFMRLQATMISKSRKEGANAQQALLKK